jgi:ribosomal-protein-alanine N-acetyltransferase
VKQESESIGLRRIAIADAEFVDRVRNQPSTLRFQASPTRTLSQIRAMLGEHAAVPVTPDATGRLSWIICIGRESAGTIQLTINGDYDRLHNNAHLGYAVHEDFQGKGIAAEAVRQLLALAFNPAGLALERVEAVAAVENLASRRVLEKCGFVFEGIHRKILIINGERIDHAAYSRLVTDGSLEMENPPGGIR